MRNETLNSWNFLTVYARLLRAACGQPIPKEWMNKQIRENKLKQNKQRSEQQIYEVSINCPDPRSINAVS